VGPLDRSLTRRWIGCMAAALAALLAVGLVSGTPLRHLVQIAPGALVLGLAALRLPWAGDAAAPIFLFWLAVMALIWLFLLGVARVITGTFSTAETALTVVIGAASLAGLTAAPRAATTRAHVRALLFLLFLALQVAAVWLSTRPGVARG
jgi:hypothetical protein